MTRPMASVDASVARVKWLVRLTERAETDLDEILRWTSAQFGEPQARRYAMVISAALLELHDGPDIIGSQERRDLGPHLRTLHVARRGRKGRHFVVLRVARANGINVVRILHDSMDLRRHLEVGDHDPTDHT